MVFSVRRAAPRLGFEWFFRVCEASAKNGGSKMARIAAKRIQFSTIQAGGPAEQLGRVQVLFLSEV